MKKNEGGADGTFGSPQGDRAVWDADSPDRGCDCPGPPPQFYLPPPPRPFFLLDSDCSDNSTSHSETCEAVPVIDAEYHYSPTIPSFAIILTVAVAVAVVVFLLIGTFLVLLKRRKMQNLFPRKSSSQNRCDSASANGVIYEDLTNLRPRTLPPNCSPSQTALPLPPIEIMDPKSYPERGSFASEFICSTPPVQHQYDSRELYNPVYEELSNGSGEGGDTDSEGMPQGAVSEDEFAEDELSLAGEADGGRAEDGLRKGSSDHEVCRDVDSSDADDKCKFLRNPERHLSRSADRVDKGRRTCREPPLGGSGKRPKSSDRRKVWKSRAHPTPPPAPPVDCGEFHEGFLLKKILQIYPDVTGVGLQYSRGLPNFDTPEGGPVSVAGGRLYESLDAFGRPHLRRHARKPEVFSTSGSAQSAGTNQSQSSSMGSDSGYSNNTFGGRPPSKTPREQRLPDRGDHAVFS